MIARRALLKWAATGVGMTVTPAVAAEAPPPPATSAPVPFGFNVVVDAARALAGKPHQAPDTSLPEPFSGLSYEQYVAIRSRAGSAIWFNDNLGFAIEPLHRGKIFSTPVAINIVEGGSARRLNYDPALFDFGDLKVPGNLPDLGFSGFRILHAQSGKGFADTSIFQGASFFRAIANGQNFGLTARALSIRTADPKGEEFPVFREFWVERPAPASGVLVIYALVDSDSMTGAYRLTFRPGDITIIDTECTLFVRSPADFYGLGCMAAMFFFGPIGRRAEDDVRDAVYEVSGLQIRSDNGEWIWRPVNNPQTLQVSVFGAPNPRGFGLLQRERSFRGFEDDDQHWERRPSLWIEPINDWGEGSVTLVEIPSDSELNENVVCFWRPKAVLQPGGEASFAYRQFWCWSPPDRPSLATVTDSRSGHGGSARERRFLVEFSGEVFADGQRPAAIEPRLSTSVGKITSMRPYLYADSRIFRVAFAIDFGGERLSELRLTLAAGDKPLSETWLYRWTA